MEKGRIPEITLSCVRKVHELHKQGPSHPSETSPNMGVSVELEKPNRPGLEALAAEADVVFHSRSWAEVRHPRCLRFPQKSLLTSTHRQKAITTLKSAFVDKHRCA